MFVFIITQYFYNICFVFKYLKNIGEKFSSLKDVIWIVYNNFVPLLESITSKFSRTCTWIILKTLLYEIKLIPTFLSNIINGTFIILKILRN